MRIRGTNITIFLLFFGVSALSAVRSQDWVMAGVWFLIGCVFLLGDVLNSKGQ